MIALQGPLLPGTCALFFAMTRRRRAPRHRGSRWFSEARIFPGCSKDFLSFLESGTGLNLKFRSSQGQTYGPGDYSLLHSEEFERKRLVVVYDFTNNWNIEWGGHDIYTSPEKDPLICNRDAGTLMLTLLDEGDYSCTRYVSLKSDSKVVIDKVIFDLK